LKVISFSNKIYIMAFAAASHVVATIQLTVEKRRTKSGKYAIKVYQASTFAFAKNP